MTARIYHVWNDDLRKLSKVLTRNERQKVSQAIAAN